MDGTDQNASRRLDVKTAELVQYGLTLQFIAGDVEAERYLLNQGISAEIVARVLRSIEAKRRPLSWQERPLDSSIP
jgi:hypothetical protein